MSSRCASEDSFIGGAGVTDHRPRLDDGNQVQSVLYQRAEVLLATLQRLDGAELLHGVVHGAQQQVTITRPFTR